MRRIPFETTIPQLIRGPHFVPKKVKLTTSHLGFDYVRTTSLRSNGFVLGVRNRQVVDIATE